jgi:hypothetical protein
MHDARCTWLLLSLLLSVGCSSVAGHKPRPLLHAQPSAEALAQQVLTGIANRDEQGLRQLVLTKEEFCQQVWPELPSSQTPNMTCDWAWNAFAPSDAAGLRETISAHGGKPYSFVRLRFAKGTNEYTHFKVHEDTRMIVIDEEGKEQELKLCGSILEYQGQFKLFSFIID